MENKKEETVFSIIIGYILLTPSIISVFMFLFGLTSDETGSVLSRLNAAWTGYVLTSGESGGGATSALPFYFGLMAIAGAYLIKDKK